MIDRLRSDLQDRLELLLAEADKLRRALGALGPHDGTAPAPNSRSTSTRTTSASARSARTAGSRARTVSAREPNAPPATRPNQPRADASSKAQVRTAPRGTKNAVLSALAHGHAMTASEVAAATGLGRASVSTTLSKLANTGEVSKAERGYRRAERSTPKRSARAARERTSA